MTRAIAFTLLLVALSGCGCLNPWTKLSDCPRGTPGNHGGSQ